MLRFRSKVDWWLGVLLVAIPVITFAIAIGALWTGDWAAIVTGWATAAGVVALYAIVVWPVVYDLEAEHLVIRFGVCRSRVPYSEIVHVRPSRNPLSSPALSLRRLAIECGRGGMHLISPADRAGFVRALQERAPHVEVERSLLGEARR